MDKLDISRYLEPGDYSGGPFYAVGEGYETADGTFVIVQVPNDDVPSAIEIHGRESLAKEIRKIYQRGDQKYLFVVRGTLGKLKKSKSKLMVTFGSDMEIKVPVAEKCVELADGWLGS